MSHDLDRLDEIADGGHGASREDAGAFITSFFERYRRGFKNISDAMDALAEAQEHFCPEVQSNVQSSAVEEPEPSNGSPQGAKQAVGLIKVLDYLALHPDKISFYCVCKAPNLPILNDNPAVQHLSMAQFARKIGVSKEAVRKRMEHVQQHFGYPPLPEQRSATSCKRMSEKRIAQLKKT